MYYYIGDRGRYNISCFEVIPLLRSKGTGEQIIKQFLKENKIASKDIWVEPVNIDAARFWRKCGIECYCASE